MTTANTIVLVVDDTPAIAELLEYSLHEDEWVWYSVPSLAHAWDFFGRERPALLLQESLLRQEGGPRLLARLSGDRRLRDKPVILLAAKCTEGKRGAPLPPPVPESIAQQPLDGAPEERLLRLGRLVLDPLSRSVRVGSHKVEVRHAEYRLLRFLLCHPGQVFSRAQLLEHVWAAHDTLDQRTVDVHVLRLRKALGRAKSLIKTVRGAGYMLSST